MKWSKMVFIYVTDCLFLPERPSGVQYIFAYCSLLTASYRCLWLVACKWSYLRWCILKRRSFQQNSSISLSILCIMRVNSTRIERKCFLQQCEAVYAELGLLKLLVTQIFVHLQVTYLVNLFSSWHLNFRLWATDSKHLDDFDVCCEWIQRVYVKR